MKKNEQLMFSIKKKTIAKLGTAKTKLVKGGRFIACTEMDTFCPCTLQ